MRLGKRLATGVAQETGHRAEAGVDRDELSGDELSGPEHRRSATAERCEPAPQREVAAGRTYGG